jgi:hypothetical protein
MLEELYKICDKALEVFPDLKQYYESVKKQREEHSLVYPAKLIDVNKYNFLKIFIEAYNNEVMGKFMNVVSYANCLLAKREYPYVLVIHYLLRDLKEQAKLWFQGRYTKENVVTWVIPGESLHNYGLAMDLVFWKEGSGFSWKQEHPWDVVQNSATRFGLATIKGDLPHSEYRLKEIMDLKVEVTKFIAKEMKKIGLDPFLMRKTIPAYLKGI